MIPILRCRTLIPYQSRKLIPYQSRKYHYSHDDIYGFRNTMRAVEIPDCTDLIPSLTPFLDTAQELDNRILNSNLLRLVHAYRAHGHRLADLDPLNLTKLDPIPELDPKRYGIDEKDGKSYHLAGIVHIGKSSDPSISREKASIDRILSHLKNSYTGRIGFEFAHLPSSVERRWFAGLVESYEKPKFTPEQKKYFWSLLSKSEVFDHFMAKKFPQVKRYGLEGSESMMIVLQTLFQTASVAGLRDAIVCMPHRGRLNLLTDLLTFPPEALFHKVKGNSEMAPGLPATGDVISHLAISTDLDLGTGKPFHVSMLHNPSHLEAANPVALGKARARQMYLYEAGTEKDCYLGDRVVCVQMHGDAAFTGQGVVTETLGLSNLPHFTAGGSIHVIVNNQIGYTTPSMNARSTVYTSDVGKMINCPVLHVNADFPEDVAFATKIAFEYRQTFRKDVILDMISYRRMGHNELDEPAFTQPIMYKKIRSQKSVPVKYEEQLVGEKLLSKDEITAFRADYYKRLEEKLEKSYSYKPEVEAFKGKWKDMVPVTQSTIKPNTGVDLDLLKAVGLASVATHGVSVHSRIAKYHIENRVSKVNSGKGLDWATCEALAFGSLLSQGYHVRISGQDVGRGTFSQRHAMLVDSESERTVIPLNAITKGKKQAKLEIANSHLSEYAVLGFEYGVSWETPNRLCIWEAQFGDFFNGAQIVIDVYLASGETKWMRQSGLVMLLPHGYDGAGPEHSSCRIERFLQLCDNRFDVENSTGNDNANMQVVNPTTPAQYFHVLRRQMVRNYRKPLIVVGPKALLRSPVCTSELSEMGPGTTWLPVLSDPIFQSPASISKCKRVCFVSGKLYYDLIKERSDRKKDDEIAFVRIEELNPFPAADIKSEIQKFSHVKDFFWVQEEPENQGAYSFMAPRIGNLLGSLRPLKYHGRGPSAAPATGISSVYKIEQKKVITGVFETL